MMLPLSGHLDGEGPNALNKDIRYRGGLQGFFNVSRPESRLRSSSADREQCADAKMIKLPRSGEELAYDAAVAEPTFQGSQRQNSLRQIRAGGPHRRFAAGRSGTGPAREWGPKRDAESDTGPGYAALNKLHAAASFGLGYWHADLVLAQVLCVVESSWVGVAAKLGRSHVAFWLGAMLLYYIPLAAVVIYLNRLMPLQGGLYQWAKAGFNQFV